IAEEDITEMLLQLLQTGHTQGITTIIEETQILPIIEGVQTPPIIETQRITGEAQIPHTTEEVTTTIIILSGEVAETRILLIAIAEGSIQIHQALPEVMIVEPAGAPIVMLLKAQGHLQDLIHRALQAAQDHQVV